jgi:hypothetical protein
MSLQKGYGLRPRVLGGRHVLSEVLAVEKHVYGLGIHLHGECLAEPFQDAVYTPP